MLETGERIAKHIFHSQRTFGKSAFCSLKSCNHLVVKREQTLQIAETFDFATRFSPRSQSLPGIEPVRRKGFVLPQRTPREDRA